MGLCALRIAAFLYAWHAELLVFGAVLASWSRVSGLLMPGGLRLDTWSRHFQWTQPSCFCFCNYSMLNGEGPVRPGLVQTL